MKTKNILNKFVFIFLLTFTFSLSTAIAQNDTVYVMKNGNVVGKYNVNTEVDSVIFYQLEIPPGDTMYVMKNGNVQGKYNVKTEVDSVIFYQMETTPLVETIGVQITLPAGLNYNLAGSKVMSYSTWSDVDASGKSEAAHSKQSVSIAYLFDKNDNLIMAGFITDSLQDISPASTAKVLLYLTHELQFQPFALTESYLKQIDQIPGAIDWVKEYENIFIGDPLTFSNGSYSNVLKSTIEKMTAQNPVDIHPKSADITVNDSDIKSGLQVAEDGLGMFSVTNYYRRRAHVFLYKMNYTDLSGNKNTIKEKIDINSTSDKNFPVDPIAGVTSVLGEVGKYIEDKDLESFAVKTNPIEIKLESNESESKYKVRIIGPGMPGALLTNDEDSTLLRLEMETFALDVVIPAMSILMSLPETKESPTVNKSAKEKIIENVLSLSKNIPDVYEEIKKGSYNNALKKLIENLYKDAQATNLSELIDNILLFKNLANPGFYKDKVKNLNTILAGFDVILGTTDVFRIINHVSVSKTLEEWDITARSSQVKLLPKESTVLTLTQQKISAEVKNLDESGDTHPFFEWSTSGNYGTLSDTKGNTGTSFESADKDIFYRSNAKTTDLSDGNNYEYIYVKAYLGSKLLGIDTAKINVKKYKYEMKPEGITLTGKKGGANEATLYLEIPKGGIPIQPNNDVDFKVVWSTAGQYGKLYGVDIDAVTSLTTYDDNKAWYDCKDKDTKQAVETIYARIYSKAKDEENYSLFDEVKGTINILNDPKKRIIHVPLELIHGDTITGPHKTSNGSEYYSYRCYKANVITFDEDTAAISYSVKFIHVDNPIGGGTPSISPWNQGEKPYDSPPSWARPGYANGQYTVVYSWGSNDSPTEGKHVNATARTGIAEVTILLK